MKNLKNIFVYNYLDIALFTWVFLIVKDYCLITGFIILCALFYLKHHKVILLILIFLIFLIPVNHKLPCTNQGKVTDIKKSYYIVSADNCKILLYTDVKLNYDMQIKFDGTYRLIESSPSFYGFNFQKFNNKQNIFYQIKTNDIEVIKQEPSLRSIIYNLSDDAFFYKFIFNINNDDILIDNLINTGFTFVGFIYIFELLTKRYLTKDVQNKIKGMFYIFFAIFYHFNFITFRLLLKHLLSYTKYSYKNRVGLCFLICMIVYPHNILSLKFMLPFINSLVICFGYDKKILILFNMILQSFLFNSLNIITLLGYRYISYILGACYIIAWLSLIIDMNNIVSMINNLFGYFNNFVITGSNKSIFVIVVFLMVLKAKHRRVTFILIYIFCLSMGLFFPLASVNIINVDQGDAILISDIFNTHHYLIDTGKPSAYNRLKTFLDARRIKKIDVLFISHYDSDHCGNLEQIQKDYCVERVVDYHFNYLENNRIKFTDLNNNYYPETNDSSQVIFTTINKHNYLFMNDAPKFIEKEIVSTYDKLNIDYLLVGHHGSDTSTSDELLFSTKPKVAIISSGINNFYNHPSSEVIKRLNNHDIPYLNTAYDGDISIYITSFCDILITSNKKIGIIHSR